MPPYLNPSRTSRKKPQWRLGLDRICQTLLDDINIVRKLTGVGIEHDFIQVLSTVLHIYEKVNRESGAIA